MEASDVKKWQIVKVMKDNRMKRHLGLGQQKSWLFIALMPLVGKKQGNSLVAGLPEKIYNTA
jgi:hypothetical protein